MRPVLPCSACRSSRGLARQERAVSTPAKPLQAVALAYGETDAAPRVVAKGRGLLAEEIIRRAQEAGVYVHESPELVSLLMQVDLDERIPPTLYIAVAELLAWLYRLEKGLPEPAASTRLQGSQ
ncbi:MAG: EscU/YscU/HrcU family type III secretion system export apparatus switch protein [Hydrogenophilaceae bacterium]|nr:EscU/YscU/HrcU family type III secretion system export apparatus switch protein [Hydrogenophilaceae bacterium]